MIHFTREEAQALLPRLRPILEEVRELKRRVDARIAAWRHPSTLSAADTALARGQMEFLMAEINGRADRITRLGGLLKDADKGLVDFPAFTPEGEEVYLCWRLGEDTVAHWHDLTEGFEGRKPLSALIPGRRS